MITLVILMSFGVGAWTAITPHSPAMARRTALNPHYSGLVESISVPAALHSREDGRVFASCSGVVPIHCVTAAQVSQHAATTHHYCDLFTDELLAPLGELAYVRLDDDTAEKVFINRSKRILIVSSDGKLAQWRAAPTFESANSYIAGAPLVNKDGALVSLVTAKRGNHYAVSSFEGEGGYFETENSWKILEPPEGSLIYGDKWFTTREALRAHIEALPEGHGDGPSTPVLHVGASPRIALVGSNGRQIAHHYLHAVLTDNVEYL